VENDENLVKLLTEMAFIAGGHAMVGQAEAIAAGLKELRPKSALPDVVRAAALLSVRDLESAERVLRQDALKADPADQTAKAHLALVLRLQHRAGESERIVGEILAAGDDPDAVAMAERIRGLR
jgi:hypothetical protein